MTRLRLWRLSLYSWHKLQFFLWKISKIFFICIKNKDLHKISYHDCWDWIFERAPFLRGLEAHRLGFPRDRTSRDNPGCNVPSQVPSWILRGCPGQFYQQVLVRQHHSQKGYANEKSSSHPGMRPNHKLVSLMQPYHILFCGLHITFNCNTCKLIIMSRKISPG